THGRNEFRCRSRAPAGDSGRPFGEEAVDEEHDDRPRDRADESGAFACLVPVERLPEIGGDEGADDAQDGGQDEARRLVTAGHDELRNDADNKADDDGPDDAHWMAPYALFKSGGTRWQTILRRAVGLAHTGAILI